VKSGSTRTGRQAALARDLLGVASRDNTARDGGFRVASAHLEAVAVRAA
jgi:hypothetical protein